MNSGWKADQAADELASLEAKPAKWQATTYAIIEPGPVLKCYVNGALIVEAALTPTEALRMIGTLAREIRL